MERILIIVLLSINLSAWANDPIRGLVKDEYGRLLAGTNVNVKNSEIHLTTDENGTFEIITPIDFPITLKINYIGFKTKEIHLRRMPRKRLEIVLNPEISTVTISFTARRRTEAPQDIPIPLTVIEGVQIDKTGAFNLNRLKEFVPTMQFYTSNTLSTALNIRGLGSPFGLTNDGIDPGVGFYIDGVYYARQATTALDFVDVKQMDILRGPQGTLFGKNTTAGVLNVTTRQPSFVKGANFELSYGNFDFIQAKASVTGPLAKNLATRISFSGTQRDGMIYDLHSQSHINALNNLGARGQLRYTPSEHTEITFSVDHSRQQPEGYAQVFAGSVPTQRPPYRQFENIIQDLNYDPPNRNPFDRAVDHNTAWRSNNDMGGSSLNINTEIGKGTLTSTTAWRYLDWNAPNDRDLTGLSVLQISEAPSKHQQWSQEVRYSGDLFTNISGVIGVFAIGQNLRSKSVHTEEAGNDLWRFAKNTESPLWQTPNLLQGFGMNTRSRLRSFSGAVFAQLDWQFLDVFHFLPGIRFNYETKNAVFDRQTYGGLQTADPELIAMKQSIYRDQHFSADVQETHVSGQITLSYRPTGNVNSYAIFSTNFKPAGVNLNGLPYQNGTPTWEQTTIKPEYVRHYELGFKAKPKPSTNLNLSLYYTDIKDYQTQVQTSDWAVNRGYLTNAERVGVFGFELDASTCLSDQFTVFGALAFTDAKYISFTNAPVPLEETATQIIFKDISGGQLPGISKWAFSYGGEFVVPTHFLGRGGDFFLATDGFLRSSFSSSPSPSRYLNIPGYHLLNVRLGFRRLDGWTLFGWTRNLFNKNYFEQLLPGAGNAGHYGAVLGDQRTFGSTLSYQF